MKTGTDLSLKFANIISVLFNPLWFGILLFIWLIIYFDFTFWDKVLVIVSGLTAAVVFPIIIVVLMVKSGKSVHMDIPERKQRMRPFAYFALVYFVDIIINYVLHLPMIFQAIMWIFLINTLIYWIITYWWKISIHTAGLSGYIMTVCVITGNYPLLIFIPILFVSWSRIVLKAHSIAQVSMGIIMGLLLTYFQLTYYIKIFSIL